MYCVSAQEKKQFSGIFIVDKIEITGNKRTKPQIIVRELIFKERDTISRDNVIPFLKRSRENLINTSLFNFVYIDTIPLESENHNLVRVRLIERWPIIPDFNFKFMDRNLGAWWETRKISRLTAGADIIHYNIRGRRENLILGISIGFNERLSLTYLIPFINRKQTIGIGASLSFVGNRDVAYITSKDRPVYFFENKRYLKKWIKSYMQLVYRPTYNNTHTIKLIYEKISYNDTLNKLNPCFGPCGILMTGAKFYSINYQFKSEKRNNKFYPLKGYYFDLDIEKKGIFKGDDLKMFSIHSTLKNFLKIYQWLYWGSEISGRYCFQSDQSYLATKALGYDRDYVRGYEHYVIDGQNFALIKSNLKFEILKPHIYHFKFIRNEKFSIIHYALYLNLFADCGYVSNEGPTNDNLLPNTFLFGTGIGLDFVTYYDKIIRIEYSFNKLMEKGIFVSFITAI